VENFNSKITLPHCLLLLLHQPHYLDAVACSGRQLSVATDVTV